MPFVRQNVKLPSYTLFLWRNCRICLPKILFPVFMFAFIFSLPLIFIWPLAFLIFLPPLWNFYVFLPTKFVSFVFTRFSCSSVIHVSVNIKDNIEKDTTLLLLLLFPSKSPGGHTIFFRCIWVAIPVDEVFLYWCAYGANGRAVQTLLFCPTPPPLPHSTWMSTHPRPQIDPADKLRVGKVA